MRDDVSVVLAAPQGPLRDGLHAAMGAIPRVALAQCAGDAASVLARVTESPPNLLVVEDALQGDTTLMLLQLIKAVSPDTRCLVLTDEVRRLDVAASHGADAVMLQGTPPEQLFDTITRLLDVCANAGPAPTKEGDVS